MLGIYKLHLVVTILRIG